MLTFLLVVQAIISAALVTVILMQRSEGGGLTSGGSPSGLMSARGAADFLTRSTAVLATCFVVLSIGLALYVASGHKTTIDTTLSHRVTPDSGVPTQTAPVATPGNLATPVAPANDTVPLQQ